MSRFSHWISMFGSGRFWALCLTALAMLSTLILRERHSARRDLSMKYERDDLKHANEIEKRVSDLRAEPDRLRPFKDAGYRD